MKKGKQAQIIVGLNVSESGVDVGVDIKSNATLKVHEVVGALEMAKIQILAGVESGAVPAETNVKKKTKH